MAMLLRLRTPLSSSESHSILGFCKELGYRTRYTDETRRLLELTGPGHPSHRSRLEDHVCVLEVLDAPPELHERSAGRADTVVAVGEARFGGGKASLIAGPCAVEDGERLVEIAHAARGAGATVLRGGAFKPRTSPWSFQGLGADGLALLERARVETGLAIVSEVLDPRDVEAVHDTVDMFQIGSRSMSSSPLLKEVGKTRKPVLLKRGFAATVREFLLAAEYVLAGGNEQVVLCERGIRGFDTVTRNVLDVGTVAYLKRATHLPVVVDPSHAAGRSELVRPLARAGLAAGADGLIVEVHPHPEEVRSDGEQAVSFQELGRIAADARALLALEGRELVSGRLEGAAVPPETAT